jgi:hypothetical protein
MSDAWLIVLGATSVLLLIDLLIVALVIKICRACGCCDDPENPQEHPINVHVQLHSNRDQLDQSTRKRHQRIIYMRITNIAYN